ncbi:NADH-quinone oxidoreductase subunit M [Alicyclobacillus cellulosilyticus]|uniref:NADH-quinone oxidoreductase subunit M n=1 Tax=Alicyclobacillus cellulosilyticus TaxID=1003997 RepID=A0A917KGP8_9BACL|nr:NADH-quinone oxidoreductase subunit M [Alicyclobacillus cellulosilyticus]GGJ11045.1 NADH-quinone oxidoreductase subunit M [Alicyclobacillus cellulosilyticus]
MGLPFWLAVSPLIAAVVVLALPRRAWRAYRAVALAGDAVALALAVAAWIQFGAAANPIHTALHWFTLPGMWLGGNLSIDLTFTLDGLSLPLVTLAALLGLLAAVMVPRGQPRCKEYFFWQSLLVAAVNAVFAAGDAFTFFAAVELALFASFFLLYLFGGARRREAAFKFLIYRGLSSVFLLAALAGILYAAAGAFAPGGVQPAMPGGPTFDIARLAAQMPHLAASVCPPSVRWWLFVAIVIAVFIEEALVPLHSWLPLANEQADTPTNMLLGGVLTKTGAYILLRFGAGMLPDQVHGFGLFLAVMGVINLLYGAFAAWAQKDWRRLIAYGSISHMGLVLLGIAAFNAAGLQGAMFMMVSSGILTALLFAVTGALAERTGTFAIPRLGGLAKAMPNLSGFLLFAALGSLGLPLTSGFISEIQTFIGGFTAYPAASFVALLGVILSAVYLLYAIQRTTFGPLVQAADGWADARPREWVAIVVLTGLVLLIGVWPQLIGHPFGFTVRTLLGIGG